jgi:hypothetical protein
VRALILILFHAIRHKIYRTALIEHLVEVGLTHYDPEMRSLSAQSLASIVLLDSEYLIPSLVDRQVTKVNPTLA